MHVLDEMIGQDKPRRPDLTALLFSPGINTMLADTGIQHHRS
jgi:hypothetical protein